MTVTATLTPAEFQATRANVAKIQARAAKKGFNGSITLTGTERVEKQDRDAAGNVLAFPRYVTVVDAVIEGEAPSYEGWTFIARIDRVEESFTIATAPGVDHVDRDLVRVNECDHCQVHRVRNNTYLVRGEQGQILNVGSSCIKDFLGHEVTFAFISEQSVADEAWGDFGGGYSEPTYLVADVVAVALASIEARGFVSTSAWEKQSTRDHVRFAINPFDARQFRDAYDRAKAEAEHAALQAAAATKGDEAAAVLAYLLSDDFAGQSTYVDNLKVLAQVERVEAKQFGLLVSAPTAYAKHLGKVREAEVKATLPDSTWIGTVGDKKVETTVVLERVQATESMYGTSLLIVGRTEQGQVVKTFTTAEWAWGDDVKEGNTITLVSTIKAHEEFQGTKQTVLLRAKRTA